MANPIVDPAILAAMAQYQMAPSMPVSPTSNEDLYKDQNSWMTGAGKGANLSTDMDFALANNFLSPTAFAPVTTINPVDAPGARTLATWRNSQSPYQTFIAAGFDAGKSANQILAELQKAVANPDDPLGQQIAAELPPMLPYWDQQANYGKGAMVTPGGEGGAQLPDMRAVADEIQRLETDIQSDPEHAFDANGQPVSATTEDSAAMKAWHDAGYTSDPTATYQQYDIAPSGTQERDLGIQQAMARALAGKTAADVQAPQNSRAVFNANKSLQDALNPQPVQPATPVSAAPEDVNPWAQESSRRQEIPQRGGVADDAARFAKDPLGAGQDFVKGLFGRAADVPGAVTRIPSNVDQWTQSAAGAADRAVGDPLESRAGGQQPLFGIEHSYSDPSRTHNFWMPFTERVDGTAGVTGGAAGDVGGFGGGAPGTSGWAAANFANNLDPAMRPGNVPAPFDENSLASVLNTEDVKRYRKQLEDAQKAAQAGRVAKRGAQKKYEAASNSDIASRFQQAQRQAYVDQMTAAGRTPGRDEVAARNALIYGMGG